MNRMFVWCKYALFFLYVCRTTMKDEHVMLALITNLKMLQNT